MSWKPTLGTFSKGVSGSIALNFGQSGGANCSNQCKAKGRHCYAEHFERVKPSIAVSGLRKEQAGFAVCCHAYRLEIERKIAKGDPFPWVRFSTFGSIPNRPLSSAEIEAFVELVKALPDSAPVHFPVETRQKAERLRAILWAHGLQDRLVIRESAQSEQRMRLLESAGLPGSWIVSKGETKRERLQEAQRLCRELPGAAVCPAVASTILKRPKAIKCGQCTLCSKPGRIILYPQH